MPPDWIAFKAGLQAPAYSGTTNAQAAALANAPDAANPVPKTLTVASLMSAVSSASRAELYARPAIDAFRNDVVAQDRSAVGNWLQLAYDAGDLSQEEFAALGAKLAETQDGPSLAMRALGVPCSELDIKAARGN